MATSVLSIDGKPERCQGTGTSGEPWLHGYFSLATVVPVLDLYAVWRKADDTCPTREQDCVLEPRNKLELAKRFVLFAVLLLWAAANHATADLQSRWNASKDSFGKTMLG